MNISKEQYERMVLLILFETITIILFITLFDKIIINSQKYFFWYSIVVLQMPFISFIQQDFLGSRPSLVKKITNWFINVVILLVVLGIFVIIFLIDFKSGIVGSLITIVFLIILNWGEIKIFLKRKKEN